MLEKSLSDRDPLIIYGDVPKDDEEKVEDNRERRINEFKSDKRPRVLIANPSSCAESISLHKVCRHAIYLDRTFNAAHFMQSLDRIHRIGLSPSENVSYTILISRGTIDEVVDRKLRQKHSRMLSILNDDIGILNLNSSIKEFTADEEIKSDFSDVRKHLLSLKAKS
jgi:SNF2 family DNA or RNA helicase